MYRTNKMHSAERKGPRFIKARPTQMTLKSVWQRVRITVLALGASILCIVVLLALFSNAFVDSLKLFFVVPFANVYFLGNMLSYAVPLMVAGLGAAFAFASHNFNLGGEGQVYAGALVATVVALKAQGQGAQDVLAVRLAALFATALTGGLVGGFSGMLKRRLKVDEMISSFLASSLVVFVVDYLVAGPLKDPNSNFQATKTLPSAYGFAKILPPSELSVSIFWALLLVILGKLVLDRTSFGFELKVSGANKEFARYAGINGDVYSVIPLVVSGALHALAGGVMIFSTYLKTIQGFSSGVGWDAIAVALIANNNPVALVPSALFFAYLDAGSKSAMMGSNVSTELVTIAQALVFFLITATTLPRVFGVHNWWQRRKAESAEGRQQ